MFDKAVDMVLANEGGFVNDPDDPGGTTNFGISLRFVKSIEHIYDVDIDNDGDVDADDIAKLTKNEARAIYKVMFWDKYNYGNIENFRIALKIFDLCVNMGPRQAHKIIQRGLRSCERVVKDDGILGPITQLAITRMITFDKEPLCLLYAMRSEAAGFYRMLIKRNPVFKKYEDGWLNRAYL